MRRVLSLIFAVAIVAGTAMSAQAATPHWRLQDMPSPPQGVPSFSGVSCPTTTVCVAVGSIDYSDSGGHGHIIQAIERWRDGKWSVEAAPAGTSDTLLRAVSCASTTTCLAVGSSI